MGRKRGQAAGKPLCFLKKKNVGVGEERKEGRIFVDFSLGEGSPTKERAMMRPSR